MERVVAARLVTSHVIDAPMRCTHDYFKCSEQVVDRHVSIPGGLVRLKFIVLRDTK